MEKSSRDFFMQHTQLFAETLSIISEDTKCSASTLVNMRIFLEDFRNLMKCILEDIQSGEIHKMPRRGRKRKIEEESFVEIVVDNKENV